MYTPRNRKARSHKPAVQKLLANDPPPKIKQNFKYEPSIAHPQPLITPVTFVNKTDDIEKSTPAKNLFQTRTDTPGLITSQIKYKRDILITPDTKEDFLKQWTRLDFSILDKSNTREHLFIRNQIDISVASLSPGHPRHPPQEPPRESPRELPTKAAPRRTDRLARRHEPREPQVPRSRQRQPQDPQRRHLLPGLQVCRLPPPAPDAAEIRSLEHHQQRETPNPQPQKTLRSCFESAVASGPPAAASTPQGHQRNLFISAV